MRIIVGAALTVLFSATGHAAFVYDSASQTYVNSAGQYTSSVSIQLPSFFTARNDGSFSFTTSSGTHNVIGVGSVNSGAGASSGGFSFGNTGAVTITGNDTGAADYRILNLYSFGGAGSTGDSPTASGISGGITLNLGGSVSLNNIGGSGSYGAYPVWVQVIGQAGGTSTKKDVGGQFADFSNGIDATLTGSVTLNEQVGADGAAVRLEQLGGKGGGGYESSNGGSGGTDRPSTVTVQGARITATGNNALGLLVRQVGGDGGDGHDSSPRSNGGGGAPGQGVTLVFAEGASAGSVSTAGANAPGVEIDGIGGAGGKGSKDSGISANGGNGGGGAAPYNASVAGYTTLSTNIGVFSSGAQSVVTTGGTSPALVINSTGGAGGISADLSTIAGATSGNAGSGGGSGNVVVSLGSGFLAQTSGASSPGLQIVSLGGAGGLAGSSAGTTNGTSGNGGTGAASGSVTVSLASGVTLDTSGASSHGIFVQSRGGEGGSAQKVSGVFAGTGGDGGSGGSSGGVSVDSGASITTRGESARGIFVQGRAGLGGAGANADTVTGNNPGSGGNAGGNGAISASNSGVIGTSGGGAQGILAMSLGGYGGTGGSGSGAVAAGSGDGGSGTPNGGSVTVGNTGTITTSGAVSAGVLAQSVGGGGGDGGAGSGIVYGSGGNGGTGGSGGTVTATLGGSITTSGTLSHGLIAQSIGGGGGNGGNVNGASAGVTYVVGGNAGGGGTGGVVTVNVAGLRLASSGTGGSGILAQSVGGGGGSGGAAYAISGGLSFSLAAAVGGTGGSGGSGQAVTVNLGNATVQTGRALGNGKMPAFDAIGILAQSIGGGGGAGGGASATSFAVSLPAPKDGISVAVAATYSAGGSGAPGGNGGAVQVNLNAGGAVTLNTIGAGGHAILAQSVGGGGGQGGDSSALAGTIGSTSLYGGQSGNTTSVTVAVAVGGRGNVGGTGGAVAVVGGSGSTPLSIGTSGDGAYGILAQSIGGGGGNAGVGSAAYNYSGNANNHQLTVAVGSMGGPGGVGGAVSVSLDGSAAIRTTGSGAIGVLAHTVGGGGGTSTGTTVGLGDLTVFSKGKKDQFSASLAANVSVGSSGGTGGDACASCTTSINNQGQVTTVGNDAPALMVQSVGGGGGVGGSAGNDAETLSGDQTQAIRDRLAGARTLSAVAEEPSSNPFNPNLKVQTTLNLTVGGRGGSGGKGGIATLQHGGVVTTSGDYSPGLVVQSIGGGGGRGGVAVAGGEGNSLSSIVGTAIAKSTIALGASGGGGAGGNGGTVTVNLDGGARVTTGLAGQGSLGTGFQSIGILAQSIGGGGGTGADGTVEPQGLYFLGAGLSGSGGATGDGSTVTLRQSSGGSPIAIRTSGEAGHGVVLQSIGAGGGVAGAGSSVAAGLTRFSTTASVKLGGNAGSSGSASTVLVDNPILNISTSGLGAYGLVAQSVGGGGGLANATGSAVTLTALGGNGAGGGGGAVTVNLPTGAVIATSGLAAHAVIAQSVAGGGGILGAATAGVTPSLTGPPALAFNGGNSNAGAVSVLSLGSVSTTGAGAFGIVAQSVARGGGLATIGANAYAATFSNASGSGLGGTVNVTLQGSVTASGENGVGVFAQSTNGQRILAGTVTVNLGYYAPAAVSGGSGGDGSGVWIESGNSGNSMYVGQGSSIAALSTRAINYTGAYGVNVTNDGTLYGYTTLGTGTLTNRGTLVPSSSGPAQVITASALVLEPSSRILTTADFAAGTAAAYTVTGDARVGGTVVPTLTTVVSNVRVPVLTVQGTATGSFARSSTALFDFEVQPTATAQGQRFELVATGARLADPRFGFSAGRGAVASHLERVFAAGTPGFGAFFADLDRVAAAAPAEYSRRIGQFAPRSTLTVGARRAADGAYIANASMSCPVFSGATSFLTEGGCAYARAGGRTTSDGGDADRGGLRLDSATWQIGGQTEVSPGWFLGGSLAYETSWLSGDDGVKGRGTLGHGAITLKRQEGAWLFTGAVFGSTGGTDLQRVVDVSGFGGVAKGSNSQSSVGGRLRAAYTVGVERAYVRPFLNVDVIHARTGAYTEAGAGQYGLAFDAADQTTAVITPAVEVGMRTELGASTVLRSFVSAGVDIRTNDTWTGRARFLGAPAGAGSFSTSVPQDRAAARVGVGAQLFAGERVYLRAQYDGSYSSRANTHGGTLTFAYRM